MRQNTVGIVYAVWFRTEPLLDMAEDLLAVIVVLIEPCHDLSRSYQIHRSKGFTHDPLQRDREKIFYTRCLHERESVYMKMCF